MKNNSSVHQLEIKWRMMYDEVYSWSDCHLGES